MSFIVSKGFIPHETLTRSSILDLFQLLINTPLKVGINRQPKSICSIVSVVSYLIDPVNETENVFAARQRGCVYLLDVAHDSTINAACSSQRQYEI